MLALLTSTGIGRAFALLVAGVAAVTASYLVGFNDGHARADKAAEIAGLRSALDVAYQDLDAQRVAAEHSRLAAIENGRAATEAQKRIDEYETELQTRGADARCLLGDNDLRRLRQYGHGSDYTTSPAR